MPIPQEFYNLFLYLIYLQNAVKSKQLIMYCKLNISLPEQTIRMINGVTKKATAIISSTKPYNITSSKKLTEKP